MDESSRFKALPQGNTLVILAMKLPPSVRWTSAPAFPSDVELGVTETKFG